MAAPAPTGLGQPQPGTRLDLLADAEQVGYPMIDRKLTDWYRLGLVGSPTRQRSGQTGQDLAEYSSEQRSLFQAVARNAPGRKNAQLANIPVFAWLTWGEDWVSLAQLRAALRTAIGNVQRSARAADTAAKLFVDSVAVPRTTRKLGPEEDLRHVISQQLQRGRVNLAALRKSVGALYKPGRVEIGQGPVGAPLTADGVMVVITARMAAARKLDSLTDEQLLDARAQHLASWAEYQNAAPTLRETAGPRFERLFTDLDVDTRVAHATSDLLLLVGINLRTASRRSQL